MMIPGLHLIAIESKFTRLEWSIIMNSVVSESQKPRGVIINEAAIDPALLEKLNKSLGIPNTSS